MEDYNDYDFEDDDNIREPIPSKFEQMLEDDCNDENVIPTEEDVEKVIQQSIKEFNFLQELKEKREIEKIIEHEKQQRLNKFVSMKQKLNKIITIDKSNSNIYAFVLSTIELYETEGISCVTVSIEEYTNIFKLINSIRLPIHEIDDLKLLFKIE